MNMQNSRISKIQWTVLLATIIGILPANAGDVSANNCQPNYCANQQSYCNPTPNYQHSMAARPSLSGLPNAHLSSMSNMNAAANCVSNCNTGISGNMSASAAMSCNNAAATASCKMSSGSINSNHSQTRNGSTALAAIVPFITIQTNEKGQAVQAQNGSIQINQGQQNLTLFSASNQVLQGARGQVIGGAPGTMIEQDKNFIILHKGRLTMRSGHGASIVRTRVGEIKLNPNTIAIIDDRGEKSLHVIAVAGEGEALSVSSPICQGKDLTARSGQELILSSNGIEEEEFIPSEGAEIIVSGAIEKRPHVARTKASLPVLFEAPSSARAGKLARLSRGGKFMENTQQGFKGKIWDLLDPRSSAPMQIVAEAGSKFEEQDGTLKLLAGTIFVQAKSDIRIETPFLKAEAKRNAVLMLQNEETITRIKAFSGPCELTAKFGTSKIELAPGQELVVSSHELNKDELNPADFVARRIRATESAHDGLHHAINDFSITSMLHYAGYRSMLSRSDLNGKLTDRVLKTAVVVEMVTRFRGQYAYSTQYEKQQQQQQQQQQLVNADAQKISSSEIK